MNEKTSLPNRAIVRFDCTGTAVGKMRNELEVRMVSPMQETFSLATDEGAFHGGEATAPPPLALFVASLTGCVMTQVRAFARRMDVTLDDLNVNARVEWDWQARGRLYETAPKSFAIDVDITSGAPLENQRALIEAAKKGCFIGQTLGQANAVRHRIKTPDGWQEV
ncbi:MAG: OsmC-related (seleno)protein [Paracoccaceae bacterium]